MQRKQRGFEVKASLRKHHVAKLKVIGKNGVGDSSQGQWGKKEFGFWMERKVNNVSCVAL